MGKAFFATMLVLTALANVANIAGVITQDWPRYPLALVLGCAIVLVYNECKEQFSHEG